ncbi:MAG: nuclear transport factor 2 family protein [Hydrogenophaga sp.]|nr:nuclear transport factor 2 family protein [Hydrogenophaga sp.]
MSEQAHAEVLAAEDRRRAALVASDMEALADLMEDDLIHVHTTGIVQTKAQLLHHAGEFLQFYAVERGPLTVREVGPDAVIVTGSMTNTVGKRGTEEKIEVHSFVTQVWVKRAGQWRTKSFQATRLDALKN